MFSAHGHSTLAAQPSMAVMAPPPNVKRVNLFVCVQLGFSFSCFVSGVA